MTKSSDKYGETSLFKGLQYATFGELFTTLLPHEAHFK